jgi:hypothetical protein
LQRVARDSKVVLQYGGVLAHAGLHEHRQCALHLCEPLLVSQICPREAAIAERSRGLGKALRLRECAGSIGRDDGLAVGT